MGLQRLRVNFDVVLDCFTKSPQLLERVVGICGSVSCRWTRVWETMGVSVVVGLRTRNIDSWRHGGGWNTKLKWLTCQVTTWRCLCHLLSLVHSHSTTKRYEVFLHQSTYSLYSSKLEWIDSSFRWPTSWSATGCLLLVAVSRLRLKIIEQLCNYLESLEL